MTSAIDQTEVLSQLTSLIGKTFQTPAESIDATTVATDIAGWDSLSHTVLMFTIEEHFGVELDPEVELTDVGHLASLIQASLANPG